MSSNQFTAENAKKFMKFKGEVRGVVFKTDADYVLRKKGDEGLKKVEEELEKIGYPIKYSEIKTMDFYPVGYRILSLLAIEKAHNFSLEKIREMGFFATKTSLIVKLFVKYFFSANQVFFKEAPKIWSKHWTFGELTPIEMNEEKKQARLQLSGIDLDPLYCEYMKGYFSGILQMIVKTQQIIVEETKCTFRGDDRHEYSFKWI